MVIRALRAILADENHHPLAGHIACYRRFVSHEPDRVVLGPITNHAFQKNMDWWWADLQ
jgi:hypothetical protein